MAKRVSRVLLVRRVLRENKDLLAPKVYKEKQENRVLRDPLVLKVSKVKMELEVKLELEAKLVQKVSREKRVLLV